MEKTKVLAVGRGNTMPIYHDLEGDIEICESDTTALKESTEKDIQMEDLQVDRIKENVKEIQSVLENEKSFSCLNITKEELDNYTYIELKNTALSIKDAVKQLDTLESLRRSLDTLAGMAKYRPGDSDRTYLPKDIATASILSRIDDTKDFDLEKYDEEVKQLKESLSFLQKYVDERIEKDYSTENTKKSSFLTKEMLQTLDNSAARLNKELLSIKDVEGKEKERKELQDRLDHNFVQKFLYEDRANAVKYFMDALRSGSYTSEIRKTKQHTRSMYEKTFIQTKKKLDMYFPKNNLIVFDRMMKDQCKLSLSVRVRILVLFERLISRLHIRTRNDSILKISMHIIIANLADIYANLWDEDMPETKEYIIESMKQFDKLFKDE